MEVTNQQACPNTVASVRRNPPRRAKATPSADAPNTLPSTSSRASNIHRAAIPSFPIQDLLSLELDQNTEEDRTATGRDTEDSQTLKVFLRIRPSSQENVAAKRTNVQNHVGKHKNAPSRTHLNASAKENNRQQNRSVCVTVNDCHSVTLTPPQSLKDLKRTKAESFSGFSRVFSPDDSQNEVFEAMVGPMIENFLEGRSGMLVSLGPTGSGKTHTLFGTARDPGMVPLSLRKMLRPTEATHSKFSRFYMSMFEIYVEGGKREKVSDLLSENGERSGIKDLTEVLLSDIGQAESTLYRGLLRRSTATTNSNGQSSRSQCIINIRNDANTLPGPVLAISDLAGAEREKKTGHQGPRLVESNFINNTSMAFGLCLRSLLEHQKNPKKPLRRHFQNSLLTRHLREYLEGKKPMALLLTVKPWECDYLDTSFVLRQASPYMNIRFPGSDEQSALALRSKRRSSLVPCEGHQKRVRLVVPTKVECGNGTTARGSRTTLSPRSVERAADVGAPGDGGPPHQPPHADDDSSGASLRTRSEVLHKFSRALWAVVLRHYRDKLAAAESEAQSLRSCLEDEKKHGADLEEELESLKARCTCSSHKMPPVVSQTSSPHLSTVDAQPISSHAGSQEVESVDNSNSGGKCSDVEPRRRLQPVSSVLVRDMAVFGLRGGDRKEKGRCTTEKKAASVTYDERSDGNAYLARLLSDNLPS